jgi:hypothetical protein
LIKFCRGWALNFRGDGQKLLGNGGIYTPHPPGICTPAKNQDKFSKFSGLDSGKKYEKSRQKLTEKPGPGLEPSGRGRDFENEFSGAGEKTRIPAVSEAGAGIPVDH